MSASAWSSQTIIPRGRGSRIEHIPDWLALRAVLGARVHRLPAILHPLHPERQPGLDREIARYGLMCVTFIGGAMVTRRASHIAVVLLPNLLPAWTARALLALVDLVTLGFLGLLAYFSVLIVERMQVQRMTVIDLSMSYVYGAVAFGCFLMLGRQLQRVWRNARDGWRSAQEALTAGLVTEPESAKP